MDQRRQVPRIAAVPADPRLITAGARPNRSVTKDVEDVVARARHRLPARLARAVLEVIG